MSAHRECNVDGACSVVGLPMADGGPGPLAVRFDADVARIERDDNMPIASFVWCAQRYYHEHARRFVDALVAHAPGGLVDAIFGDLCHRKASVFRVASPLPSGVPDETVKELTEALRKIAYDPLGPSDANAMQILNIVTKIARAALAKAERRS